MESIPDFQPQPPTPNPQPLFPKQTNGFEEEYGVERLLSHLAAASECASAAQIAEDIVRSIDDHSRDGAGRGRHVDDRTIVILRVTDPISSFWHGL